MSALQSAAQIHEYFRESRQMTLLELVQTICDVTDDDREVIATVRHLLGSGRVRLCGNFRGCSSDSFRD